MPFELFHGVDDLLHQQPLPVRIGQLLDHVARYMQYVAHFICVIQETAFRGKEYLGLHDVHYIAALRVVIEGTVRPGLLQS